jgi:hypothetical protein
LNRITKATPQDKGVLSLTFDNGNEVSVDFTHLVRQGGVFAQLADPVFFNGVSVSADGRYVEWPGNLDFCADALLMEGSQSQGAESTAGN